jgi:hypothetical protein
MARPRRRAGKNNLPLTLDHQIPIHKDDNLKILMVQLN